MDFLNHLQLDDPYVQHTLFAFASLALGLLGMVLGQRVSTNGKLCMVFGLLVGGLSVFLLFTPWGYLAPGWCGVFVVSFLASDVLTKLACAGNKPPKADAGSAGK